MVPSMGQGALGIEAIDDPKILEIVKVLEDEYSRVETTIERDFVDELEGGCQVPIGVSAEVLEDDRVLIKASLGLPDGSEMLQDSKTIHKREFTNAGRELAKEFISKGAKELLSRAETMMETIR